MRASWASLRDRVCSRGRRTPSTSALRPTSRARTLCCGRTRRRWAARRRARRSWRRESREPPLEVPCTADTLRSWVWGATLSWVGLRSTHRTLKDLAGWVIIIMISFINPLAKLSWLHSQCSQAFGSNWCCWFDLLILSAEGICLVQFSNFRMSEEPHNVLE